MQRVFMIGWDGATFDLIHPWVAAGKLPNIAALLKDGAHGPLRSTLPPWTFPAWSSFMTGKNPGKHGIYDFFRPKKGSYGLEFVNGSHRRAATFWQILSEAGRAVISISVPTTFPPEKVNGVMISGFDFPGEGPGSFVDARGMYPPELYPELLRQVGPHPIDAAISKEINEGRLDVALERILDTVRKKTATAKHLMQNKPWDCFMMLYGESDGTGHQFWRYCDPKSPLYEKRPGLEDALLRVYQELDRQLGELLSLVPAQTTVLMMSDHGFGGVSDWIIYPNCWLQEKGFITLRGQTQAWLSRLRDRFKFWGVVNLPAWFQRLVYRYGGRLISKVETGARYGIIDWSQTRAYFDENPYFPALRVNLRGRQPGGIVSMGTEYEELRTRLIEELESWRQPQTGEPIVERAYRREEVYTGPWVQDAPDVVVKWNLCHGYSYAFRNSSKSPDRRWIERVDPTAAETQKYYAGKSGTHRDDGIFVAHGPPIRPDFTVDGARIIDLAPTILHLLHVPVPPDMDGRVLEEVLTDDYVTHNPVQTRPQQTYGPIDTGEGVYSAADEEKIEERLKSLGYVE